MSDEPRAVPWPDTYRCLHQPQFERDGFAIRPIRWDDIEPIREWRNGQLEVLRQVAPLTPHDQERYFRDVVRPQLDADQPDQVLVGFLQHGELIGYGGLVHINWANDRGEVSFLVPPDRARGATYAAQFSIFLDLLGDLALDLGLHRLTTETFEFRHETIAILESRGFVREGRLRQHQRHAGTYADSLVHGLLLAERPTPIPIPTPTPTQARSAGPRPGGRAATRPTGRPSVLLTSASAKVPLLRAVERAAGRLEAPLEVIAGDLDPHALTSRVADHTWAMPPATDDAFPELLAGLEERAVHAIVPTRDGELAFFARHADELRERGIAVMVSPAVAVDRCLDKLEFARFATGAGLPAIPTTSDADADELGPGPYVVKERFGAGSRSIGLGLGRAEAEAWAAELDEPLFQPMVEGPEVSIDVYVAGDGTFKGAVPRSRDEVVAGESRVTTTLDDDDARELGRAVAEKFDLRGHAVIQAIHGAGGYRLVECNCRVGGASTLAFAAGLDSLWWFLLEATGGDGRDQPFRPGPIPMRLIRVPSDVIV